MTLETRAAEDETGTLVEINGGNMQRVEDAGLPLGTTLAIRDLFFNTPARRKFLKSESTELQHIAALVTHYALAHPQRHFELHSSTQALLVAPAVANAGERLFQIFGAETAGLMLPTTAEMDFTRAGLPEPPPWKREEDYEPPDPGFIRITGFVSKPELQRLNRNSIYVFVNHRLVRDRLVLHALTEAYRNIIPPTSFPVVLLFVEMPPQEVDVNVHPAKTEVRFRQTSFVHDFIRDTVRATLMNARPAQSFASALIGAPYAGASASLLLDVSPMPGAPSDPVFEPMRRGGGLLRRGAQSSGALCRGLGASSCGRPRWRRRRGGWRLMRRRSRWGMTGFVCERPAGDRGAFALFAVDAEAAGAAAGLVHSGGE